MRIQDKLQLLLGKQVSVHIASNKATLAVCGKLSFDVKNLVYYVTSLGHPSRAAFQFEDVLGTFGTIIHFK